jgi:hypothetical protein
LWLATPRSFCRRRRCAPIAAGWRRRALPAWRRTLVADDAVRLLPPSAARRSASPPATPRSSCRRATLMAGDAAILLPPLTRSAASPISCLSEEQAPAVRLRTHPTAPSPLSSAASPISCLREEQAPVVRFRAHPTAPSPSSSAASLNSCLRGEEQAPAVRFRAHSTAPFPCPAQPPRSSALLEQYSLLFDRSLSLQVQPPFRPRSLFKRSLHERSSRRRRRRAPFVAGEEQAPAVRSELFADAADVASATPASRRTSSTAGDAALCLPPATPRSSCDWRRRAPLAAVDAALLGAGWRRRALPREELSSLATPRASCRRRRRFPPTLGGDVALCLLVCRSAPLAAGDAALLLPPETPRSSCGWRRRAPLAAGDAALLLPPERLQPSARQRIPERPPLCPAQPLRSPACAEKNTLQLSAFERTEQHPPPSPGQPP